MQFMGLAWPTRLLTFQCLLYLNFRGENPFHIVICIYLGTYYYYQSEILSTDYPLNSYHLSIDFDFLRYASFETNNNLGLEL